MTHTGRHLAVIILSVVWLPSLHSQSSPTNKWEPEIEKIEQADRQKFPSAGGVLFIGSSSIRLWQSLPEDFPGIKALNRGFGGSEIADCTYFSDRIVVPYHPRLVVLYAGDNDLAAGRTATQVFEDYRAFVSRVRQQLPGTRIAFISIKPSPARVSLLSRMRDANQLIKTYSARDKRLAYIDVFTRMLDASGNPRAELFGPDGLHMNKQGYSLWQSVIAPYLQ